MEPNELVLASHGNLAKVEELVQARPELINEPGVGENFGGETPLAAASHTHNRAIAETLLANGAEHDVYTAVFMNERERVEAFLHENPPLAKTPGIHDIPILAFATTPEMAEYLIAHGAEVNAMSRVPFQTTALHGATRRGYAGVVDVLLRHGADTTVADYNGKTPVELVSAPEIAAIYRAHGVPVE
jgi:ankyrin repeat protein